MTIAKELSTVSVPVTYYHSYDSSTEELVAFTVFQENEWYSAVPLLTATERRTAGLPEKLVFRYMNYCVAAANDMEEDTLAVIKKIIQELDVQELI